MSPEEFDIEEYLAKIKQRWNSSLLSDDQNEKIYNNMTREMDGYLEENEKKSLDRNRKKRTNKKD